MRSKVIHKGREIAGDIVLSNGNDRCIVAVDDYKSFTKNEKDYVPIGIVVIPSNHMDDGRARMMSTRWMSYADPEDGINCKAPMAFGRKGGEVKKRDSSKGVPILESSIFQYIHTMAGYGYLPSDYPYYSKTSNDRDVVTKWSAVHKIIPSPYLDYKYINPLYRIASLNGDVVDNVMRDFNGRHLSDELLKLRGSKDYGSWKPGRQTLADYPAVSCCDIYHTIGTNQGDWYLPSVGELGYLVSRLGSIMIAMARIEASDFLYDCTVWSSTKYAPNDTFYVSLNDGYVGVDCDERINSVLAFAFVQEKLPPKRDFWTGKKANEVCFFPCFFLDNLVKYDSDILGEETATFPHISSSESEENLRYSLKFKESDFVAGDIVVWDGEQKRVVAQEGFFLSDKYTPIGVVVIPASHMDDGRARMMATRWMSCDDPENGSIIPETMVWGTATDLTGLTDFREIPVIARYDDEEAGGVTALTDPQAIYTATSIAFLPSDNPSWTGETNPEDSGTRWKQIKTYWRTTEHIIVDANNFYAASPYASDGTPNPLYRATSYSGGSLNNPLSYFDGRHQSDVILAARGTKDYTSWKPTSGTPEDFPAASCCDMYHTVGTNQGDWYLPSQAEMGYIVARLNDINNAMTKVNGMQALPSSKVWSSTEYSSSGARHIFFNNGTVDSWHLKENYQYTVVTFCSL